MSGKRAMIRAVTLAAVLGALVAGVVGYSVRSPWWRYGNVPLLGAGERRAETAIAADAWSICTTMSIASDAVDADWAQLDPDFKAGKRALAAEDWNQAIVAFKMAALRDPQNADIQNYIGYAYRRLRQLGPAMGHYQRALMLNPRHRSAHEHLGEAYLVLGDAAKAEQMLVALGNLCLIPCQEYDDLKG